MGAYEYTALNPKGREKKGTLEGDSIRQIRQQLREQELMPLHVEEVAQKEERRQARPTFRRGISVTALAVVTRQLATLVQSGTPLSEAISTVARQTDRRRLKSLLMSIRGQILEGHSLADGLSRFPHIFDNLFVATVRSGEQSGHLGLVLERLADYTEARQQLRQRVQLALIYPVILTIMAIAVVTALLTYVVPEIVGVFDNTGQELPGLTQALIAASDFLRAYGIYLLILIVLLVIGFLQALRIERFRYRYHAFLLRAPIIGRFVLGMNTARFARTLSILVASSVPLLEALSITAQVLNNLPMRHSLEKASERVREGSSLASSLERDGYFPPMIIQLINSGEASGELEKMLSHAAVSQERELQSLIAMMIGLLEPALILIMGGIVLLIVLSIMMPIFELNQMVN